LYWRHYSNRLDLLDPALLRPGRLDRLVYLGVSVADRANILATQLRGVRLEGEALDMANEIVQQLPMNLTGADLSTIATGGLLRATERLCAEADRQVLELQQKQDRRSSAVSLSMPPAPASIDQVLMLWDDDQLEPIVTLDDLRFAAQNVVPSVSAEELENYYLLGQSKVSHCIVSKYTVKAGRNIFLDRAAALL
jgi:peroxin-6